jgi:DUF1680 family protein
MDLMEDEKMNQFCVSEPVALKNVTIRDEFWGKYRRLVREQAIPYQWNALNDLIPGAEPSHAIENFRIAAGLSEGEFYGRVWQDSDVAKWLETVAYSLATHPDGELEARADELIELIGKAQQPDGYLNTYYTITGLDKRWTNEREKHELYCAGHMIEAAVAYYDATGKRRLLEIVCAFADHIDSVYGPEEGKKRGYPGHQEIELALVRLYRATGNEKYLKLSKYFIDERGKKPFYFDLEAEERGEGGDKGVFGEYSYPYRQSHLPVREQKTAVGHAVRAVYMYTGMADVAAETGDDSLADACRTLWEDVTRKQMYVTGGLGSQGYGEDFTFDYDLPNDTCYTETCAAVGLAFWARSMQRLGMDGNYGDILEQALYNGILSGMSLDGRKYFYVNPLEVWPASCKVRHDKQDVATTRQSWFNCACCPPNLARLIASLGEYVYSTRESTVYTHLYLKNRADIRLGGNRIAVSQETNYPWDGQVKITVETEAEKEFTMALRIPAWCAQAEVKVDGETVGLSGKIVRGYLKLTRIWKNGSSIELQLPMPVRRVQAHPELRANAGKVAIMRGPVVYCLEEADNSDKLADLVLEEDPGFTAEYDKKLLDGVVLLKGNAFRRDAAKYDGELYRELEFQKIPVRFTAVPYYAWNNRGEGEMTVWVRQSGI